MFDFENSPSLKHSVTRAAHHGERLHAGESCLRFLQRRIDWRMSADGAAGTDFLLRRPVLCFSGTSQEEVRVSPAGVGGSEAARAKFVLSFGEAAKFARKSPRTAGSKW